MGDQAQMKRMTLPILTDGNWNFWSKAMFVALQEEGLWDITERAAPEANPEAAEEEGNRQVIQLQKRKNRACYLIINSVHETLNYMIPARPNDPHVIW